VWITEPNHSALKQEVQIEHKPLRAVRVVGRLAEKHPQVGQQLKGVLLAPLAGDAALAAGSTFAVATAGAELVHPDDLAGFSKMYQGRVTQRQVRRGGSFMAQP
jgi:hypothetical protein